MYVLYCLDHACVIKCGKTLRVYQAGLPVKSTCTCDVPPHLLLRPVSLFPREEGQKCNDGVVGGRYMAEDGMEWNEAMSQNSRSGAHFPSL